MVVVEIVVFTVMDDNKADKEDEQIHLQIHLEGILQTKNIKIPHQQLHLSRKTSCDQVVPACTVEWATREKCAQATQPPSV